MPPSLGEELPSLRAGTEALAAMAADAYYREKLKPAIVHTTSGPGGTNAITGVVGAWIDSIPTMIISGQVPSVQQINTTKTRQIGVQEADIIKIVKSSTKFSSIDSLCSDG